MVAEIGGEVVEKWSEGEAMHGRRCIGSVSIYVQNSVTARLPMLSHLTIISPYLYAKL